MAEPPSFTKFLPPSVRRIHKRFAPKPNRRKRERITIEQINKFGGEQFLSEHKDELTKTPDKRSAFTKFLDIIDVPRNVVANIVAGIAGIDPKKARRGAVLKKVFASDILEGLGVKRGVGRGVAGFFADVALDPLTYLTAGAVTGKRILAGAPKVLKGGTKALKATQRAAVAGKVAAVSADVAKATGLSAGRIARIGKAAVRKGLTPRQAEKRVGRVLNRLLTRRVRGVRGLEAAKEARKFFVKFGEKGRTILRVPGMAKGLALKRGKAARLSREFAGGVPKDIQQIIGQQQKLRPLVREAAKTGAKATEAKKGVRGALQLRRGNLGPFVAAQEGRQPFRAGQPIAQARQQARTIRGESVKRFGDPAALKKEAAAAGEAVTGVQTEIRRLQQSPQASESVRQLADLVQGKPRIQELPRGAGVLQRVQRGARDIKQRVFGPGHSVRQTIEASRKQALTTGRATAGARAAQAFAQQLDPVAARLAPQLGMNPEQAANALFDVLEVTAKKKKFFPTDPVLQSAEKVLPLLDDQAKALLKNFRDLHGDALGQLARRGVAPGREAQHVPRVLTKEFRQLSDPRTRRTFEDISRGAARTREVVATGPDGAILDRALSTDIPGVQRVTALKDTGATVERFDISALRWNTDPDIGKSLLPEGLRGQVPQFERSIPEAARAVESQKVFRMALADIKDAADTVSIPAQALTDSPEAFQGFRRVRWENFRNTPAYQTVFKQMDGKAFTVQTADMIERFMTVSAQPQEINRMLRWSDRTLNLWKGVTLLHPAYTIRNVTQNIVGNAMAGTNMLKFLAQSRPNSRVSQIVAQMLTGKPVTGTIMLQGRSTSAKAFADLLANHNLVGSGTFSQISNISESTGRFFTSIPGTGLRKWFGLNNRFESTMKAASLYAALDDGLDLTSALQRVARAMPDLTDLSLFEKNVGRRLIPFYSWFRKNGALQLFHFLPQKPAFIAGAGKLKAAWEKGLSGDDVVPEELRPAWMQNMQAVQTSGNKEQGTVFLSASWLPFQELVKLGAGAFDVGEGARGLVEAGRPSLRFVAEQASGQDIFRRTPIPPFSPAEAVKRLPEALLGRGPLGGVLSVRPVREAFRVAEMPSVPAGVARGVLGGALQPVSAQRGLSAEFHRLRTLAQELRSKANRALQVNDQPQHDQLLRQYLNTLIQMRKLGLPSVPKAAQALFEQQGVPAGAPAFEGR